jgi:hypothetical protein
MRPFLSACCAAFLVGACAAWPEREAAGAWYRGNTHTHTLWSDGDAAPEAAVAWYRDRGYHFLVLSDHNVFQDAETWFPVAEDGQGRLKPAELDALVARFGAEQVATRATDGRREMRLLTLPELQRRFEAHGEFLLMPGEEVTASFDKLPVHVNALNLAGVVPAPQGGSAAEVLNAALDAIAAHGAAHGRPVLAHLNHPNFGWGLTWQDLAAMRADRFFEVYNGHRGVRNHGDAEHPSTEAIWDRALTLRLTELGLPPLYAVATDDSHHYFGAPTAQPGRGWIQVRARELTAAALIEAMRRGDFYASSGVVLREVERGRRSYRVEIAAEPGVEYRTRFVGTRAGSGGIGPPGELLLETAANPAVYRCRGDELYVRAVVVSSRLHPNPFAEGDRETAWTQPLIPARSD